MIPSLREPFWSGSHLVRVHPCRSAFISLAPVAAPRLVGDRSPPRFEISSNIPGYGQNRARPVETDTRICVESSPGTSERSPRHLAVPTRAVEHAPGLGRRSSSSADRRRRPWCILWCHRNLCCLSWLCCVSVHCCEAAAMAVASMRAVHLRSTFGVSEGASFGSSSVFGESLRCSSSGSSSAGASLFLQKTALQPVSVVLAAQLDVHDYIVMHADEERCL